MFADILERCRDLFSTDRRDLESLFRRGLRHDEPANITDSEMFANISQTALRRKMRSTGEQALSDHLRQRTTPIPFASPTLKPLLLEFGSACSQTMAWAEQICNRTLYSSYRGPIDMGTYLDWYSDLNGKSWFFEHVNGMRDKIYQQRLHETLRFGPLRGTWDLNSMHHLVELGKAYYLSGEEKYAAAYVTQALDWMEKNPPNMGINWVDELAVARRAIAWVAALQLMLPSPALGHDFIVRSVKMAMLHGAYLADYLKHSRDEDRSAYHLAAVSALHFIACALPEFRSSDRWREIAETLLGVVLEEEFGEEGAHRSGSVDMHRLCCEFALLPHVVAGWQQRHLSDEARRRTLSAMMFLVNMQEPGGLYQPMGASWPERALPFGTAFEGDTNGMLCLAAVVFAHEELRRWSQPTWSLIWLGGTSSLEGFRRLGKRSPETVGIQSYTQANLTVMREGWGEKDFWSAVRVVPQRSTMCADNPHDDWLHLSVVSGGTRLLTDSGSLVTGDRMASYFNSPAAHNVVVIRNAEPVPLPQGAGQHGAVFPLDAQRTWVRAGSRAWKKDGHVIWHRRDLIFNLQDQSMALCDVLEGEEGANGVQMKGEVDVEVSFQSPLELEVVQRGDLGCIFWKGVGLLRLHPFFPGSFRGFVERTRDNAVPAWLCSNGVKVEPLQRIRYTARLQLPTWMIFWMTWNAGGPNTPSPEEAKAIFTDLGVRARTHDRVAH